MAAGKTQIRTKSSASRWHPERRLLEGWEALRPTSAVKPRRLRVSRDAFKAGVSLATFGEAPELR